MLLIQSCTYGICSIWGGLLASSKFNGIIDCVIPERVTSSLSRVWRALWIWFLGPPGGETIKLDRSGAEDDMYGIPGWAITNLTCSQCRSNTPTAPPLQINLIASMEELTEKPKQPEQSRGEVQQKESGILQ